MSDLDDQKAMKLFAGILAFGSIVALIGILPIDSYGFYMFLRCTLCLSFILSLVAMVRFIDHRMEIFVIAPVGAFLFNPFFIIEQEKSTWIIFDVVAAALLAFWAWEIYKTAEKERTQASESLRNEEILLEELNKINHGSGSDSAKYKRVHALIRDANISSAAKRGMHDQAKTIFHVKDNY